MRLSALATSHLAALTFDEIDGRVARHELAILLGLHLAGLVAVWRYFDQPLWFAIPTLASLLALPALVTWRTRRTLQIQTLAPLFFLYAIVFCRFVAVGILRVQVPYQDESTLANVRLLFLQIEPAVIAAVVYTLIIQISRFTVRTSRQSVFVALSFVLGIAALGWFAAETFSHRTHGVTATDPCAYVQMAVDLATRGTPLHQFPLFQLVKDAQIKWYPIEHLGYRLFGDETGNVATVWPFGGAVWLAIAYRMVGEEGLYIATPLAAIAALIAMALLAWEYLRERSMIERVAVAAISVALLATSWEQVDRTLVPLVDVQAQLFSIVAIWAALRIGMGKAHLPWRAVPGFAKPSRDIVPAWQLPIGLAQRIAGANALPLHGIVAGLALAAAYWVRHTQLLLVVPLVVAAWRLPRSARVRFLVPAGLAAFFAALPDLIYHQQNFGSWLTPESHELALFSFAGLAKSAQIVADRFFAGNEFGYLVPFFLYGVYRAARENISKFAVIAAWLIVLVGFHLFYEALRVRDLLPEFPAVVLLTAYGIVALVRDLRRSHFAVGRLAQTLSASSAVVLFLALLLPITRAQFTLLRVVQPARVTFGYVIPAHRASFDSIAALTPRDAVIGSTMNDGAIDLYAQRATFRPGEWSADELMWFVDAMRSAGRRVYLLDDGAETSAARRILAARYNIDQIAVFDVPLFSQVDGTAGAFYEIQ